jgi:hypothetical protein
MLSYHVGTRPKRRVASAAFIARAYILAASTVRSQDIEPRQWSNTPVGVNFIISGYSYTDGGLSFDPSLPISNPHLETNSSVFGFARSLDLRGYSGKFDVGAPYTWLHGSADNLGEPVQRAVNGFGDPEFRLSVNLYGAPALLLKDLASYEQDWIVGAALQVSVPSGQYDDTRLVNIGTHRWFFKPSVSVSRAMGPWTLEATAATTFFTDDRDFFSGNTRSRAPLYSIQGHLIRSFRRGIWAAVDATYFRGGTTTINGTQITICRAIGASAPRLRSRSTHAIRSSSTPATESRRAQATATSWRASSGNTAGAVESNRGGR